MQKHKPLIPSIDEPEAGEIEQMIAESNLHAEQVVNYKAVGKQLEFVT